MHHGDWNDGFGHGNWWWIPMMIMMIAFWGGLIWLGVTLLKRNQMPSHTIGSGAPPASRPTAEEILAERLARGEIDSDDYRQRLSALRDAQP